jgi:hypothetical protein
VSPAVETIAVRLRDYRRHRRRFNR